MDFFSLFGEAVFSSMFTYGGNDLGAVYSPSETRFRLWSPIVKRAEVRIYADGDPTKDPNPLYSIPMTTAENGTCTAIYDGDAKGLFYTFVVLVNGSVNEAIDPYARAAGVNGMRGQIICLDDTDPEGWENDMRPFRGEPTDAVLYELHIRDLSTADNSGIVNKGKFLGLTETGTRSPEKEITGLDHIAELGVTHVHLLPVFDFQTVDESRLDRPSFNWGYDPKNYNLPEGSYSTDPYDGSVRIREMKQMIQALHKKGIGCVMDVVYNHTYSSFDSNFNLLVPDYYYRQGGGGFSNGSGCGNETASERSMVGKFIVDSVMYWANEYHIDGFRFDLMGLHDIDTMNEIRARLNLIDPCILMYGEGWTGGLSPLPDQQKAAKYNTYKFDNHIAVFSDDMRDCVKGSVFTAEDMGFVNGNAEGRDDDLCSCIVASTPHPQLQHYTWAKEPTQTVTYTSAHDNFTLFDKLMATNPNDDAACLTKKNMLSAAIILTSQGIPFFQAGEEFARSKLGHHNSYNAPDSVNQLDWSRKKQFKSLYLYYKGLIAFRKAHPALRMTRTSQIQTRLRFLGTMKGLVAYTIDGKGMEDSTIAVIFNGLNSAHTVSLPGKGWTIYVDDSRAGTVPLAKLEGSEVRVPAGAAYVLTRDA